MPKLSPSIALLSVWPVLAHAQALPVMNEGYSIEEYAPVPDPVNLSVAPDGTIYVGNDAGGSGGGSGAAARIHRVTPGDPPVVEEFGDSLDDPDVVLVDPDALIAPEPNSVLVGGRLFGVSPFAGYIAAIESDGTTTFPMPSNEAAQNPSGLAFDSTGTLWIASFDDALLVPLTTAGPGGATALIDEPLDLAIEPGTDRLFISLQSGAIRVQETSGALVDASFATGRATAFAPGTNGFGDDLYVVNPANGTLSRVDASGDATVIGTGFGNDGFGLDFGPDGRLYASDFDNDRILVVPESESAAATFVTAALLFLRRAISVRA